ncbi:MAG: hypothetical protein ACFFG0_24775 [Candidatus Thorarchaeota archaeon]
MNEIYGIDLSKKITPIMVRDAIAICFKQAHKEVLDLMDEYAEWSSESEREEFRNLQIELTIKNAFKDENVDFTNPKKEELINVLDNLAKLASMFRKPDIIEKHYNEIKQLIGKTE